MSISIPLRQLSGLSNAPAAISESALVLIDQNARQAPPFRAGKESAETLGDLFGRQRGLVLLDVQLPQLMAK
jgi:hypothetical protein